MPSRAPSCRHVARSIYTSNLSPLWITDEVLDNAFDRFLRVSRTAKRYGSSVPGPLEAQRRLAKRRMVGLAAVGSPVAFDVGLLFENGPPRRDELNWQAPAPPETYRRHDSMLPSIVLHTEGKFKANLKDPLTEPSWQRIQHRQRHPPLLRF
jgi:hypothetical protein